MAPWKQEEASNSTSTTMFSSLTQQSIPEVYVQSSHVQAHNVLAQEEEQQHTCTHNMRPWK